MFRIVVLMKQEKMEQMCAGVLQVILIGIYITQTAITLALVVNQVIIRVVIQNIVTRMITQLS